MKKVLTTDIALGAAMPFKSGTLDLLQDAVMENDLDLISAITTINGAKRSNYTGGMVLSGCVKTGTTTFDIPIGVIMFGTTLYRTVYNNAVTPSVGEVIVGTITETFTTAANADPVTFSDSATHNVHSTKTIVWSAGAYGSSDINFDDLIFLNDKWHVVGTTGEPAYVNSWVAANSGNEVRGLAFKKNLTSNKVEFTGGCQKSSLSSTDIFTLPSGLRPSSTRYFSLTCDDDITTSGTLIPVIIRITSAGVVKVLTSTNGSYTSTLSFEGCSFSLD
jgi:hypothetical protein